MKKTIIASLLAAIGCAAVVATLALGGSPKLNAVFEAKATSKSFTFDAAAGSQFLDTANNQLVNVDTGGVSDPIRTMFTPSDISSVDFGGESGRFVEAHPIADVSEASYYLRIDINNLTHFEIDVGVENDGGGSGDKDRYEIQLRKANLGIVKEWYDYFKPDGNGNGTEHLVWDKEDGDGTVVRVMINLYFEGDSADANLYIERLSLTWEC